MPALPPFLSWSTFLMHSKFLKLRDSSLSETALRYMRNLPQSATLSIQNFSAEAPVYQQLLLDPGRVTYNSKLPSIMALRHNCWVGSYQLFQWFKMNGLIQFPSLLESCFVKLSFPVHSPEDHGSLFPLASAEKLVVSNNLSLFSLLAKRYESKAHAHRSALLNQSPYAKDVGMTATKRPWIPKQATPLKYNLFMLTSS